MSGKIISNFTLTDGREIIFRYPQIGDAEAMLDYINTLSNEQTFIRFQGEQLTLEYEIERLKDLLKKIDNQIAVQLLVFHQSQLIGISDVIRREGCEKHTATFGITLAKNFRNQGIGKKLMKAVLDEAVRKLPGLKIIVLGVFSDNHIALKMYESFGFIKYGTLPEGVIHKDHFDDHVYMFKKI